MKIFLAVIFSLILSGSSFSQEPPKTEEKEKQVKGAELFKKAKTKINNPLELRDPFKRKLKRIGSGKKGFNRRISDGFFSNIPTIDNVPVDKIRIVGVLIGKERRAIAKIAEGAAFSKESYILKEGMTLGENDAEIKAILPGGVVLVEKIRNVYDQDEYLETVLPVISRF